MEQIYSFQRLDYSEIYSSTSLSLADKLKQIEKKRIEQMKHSKNKPSLREAYAKNKIER
ncbi:hypothetical protein IGI57_000967 [Enterococcus sp. DIV0213j]|jgi:hypothetical protein